MDSTTIRVDSDFKGTREFQKSTSVLFKSMSRNKKWELKCSRFLFRIRDFMLNGPTEGAILFRLIQILSSFVWIFFLNFLEKD